MRQNVKSTHLAAVAYNLATGVLTVWFKGNQGGEVAYEYRDVSIELFDALIAAQPHPGRRVFEPLIKPQHQYRPLGHSVWMSPKRRRH